MTNINASADYNKRVSDIYVKNYASVVNFIFWKVNDLSTAQDIAQDVFVKVFRYLETNFDESKSKFETWLRTIINRCIIDHYRTNQYGKNCVNVSEFDDEETGLSFQFVDHTTRTDNNVHNAEIRAKIMSAFATLNVKERRIANLYFVHEYEYNEIVDRTGYPMGTVKGMINRIREKLQKELKPAHA